jgi:hypothetical protein
MDGAAVRNRHAELNTYLFPHPTFNIPDLPSSIPYLP